MNVVLSSELVIGNLLIEAVTQECKEVEFSQIMKFEEVLNKTLQESDRNCYADVFYEDVVETIGIFGKYFIESDTAIHIEVKEEERDSFLDKLKAFFRKGLSEWLTNVFRIVWTAISISPQIA